MLLNKYSFFLSSFVKKKILFFQSFVKNVTSRMSGLLPATITKWFSSPSSSNTNGSAQTGEATDSSTEDEAPDSPIALQPPAKTMRYSSPSKFTYYGPTGVSIYSFFVFVSLILLGMTCLRK